MLGLRKVGLVEPHSLKFIIKIIVILMILIIIISSLFSSDSLPGGGSYSDDYHHQSHWHCNNADHRVIIFLYSGTGTGRSRYSDDNHHHANHHDNHQNHNHDFFRDKHGKEQIVCLADDHRKNRHHTSLFVRNCKLVRTSL